VAIDWSKPYGEVQGIHEAKYEQDNRQYDLHGDEVFGIRTKEWAKQQKGLGGRNLLIWEAKNIGGIVIDSNEKMESIRKKVMARLPE
jgi:hypothetical protein